MKDQTMVVGLTGQTGAGKSLVCEFFARYGLRIIDADGVAHEVMAENTDYIADVAMAFGICVLNADGTINRKNLAQVVFSDQAKLKKLNEIAFPYILREIRARIDKSREAGDRIVILDAPTLFESKANQFCDCVVSVIAPESLRRYRIIARDHLTSEEADRRIASQHQDTYYTDRSDYVIVNDQDLDALKEAAMQVLLELRARAV